MNPPNTNPKKVGSTINFTNFKINKIKNNIKVEVNVGSKSSVIVNIKDIIGKFRKPFDINYISYFKAFIDTNSEIRELKNQNYLNMCMFYVDNFKNYPGKYLAYIYYNYKDLYFIYDYDKGDTKLYDIGDLEPSDIDNLFKDKIEKIRNINSPSSKSFTNPVSRSLSVVKNNLYPNYAPPLTPPQKKESLSKIGNMKAKSFLERQKQQQQNILHNFSKKKSSIFSNLNLNPNPVNNYSSHNY